MLQCLCESHLSHNVSMPMAGSKVQRRVVAAVHDINASSSHDEHVHHVGAALSACPVKRAEAVVISAAREKHLHSGTAFTKAGKTNHTFVPRTRDK